jgi:D-glycero-alpha-D-manno-heptose-7-phosphate kinase
MAVALVHALNADTGGCLATHEVAELACSLEIDYLGLPIGRQDQYASAFGGLNTIEFSTDGVTVTPLPAQRSTIRALDERLLLFATGTRRHSGTVLSQQHANVRANPASLEGLHRLKALAYEMCERLCHDDLDGFGELLHRAWLEKRQLSAGVSSPLIDSAYEAARANGALGGKIAGAGGGGFMLLYCPLPRQLAVRQALSRLGLIELPFHFDYDGATVAGIPVIDTRAPLLTLAGAQSDRSIREEMKYA